MNNNGVIYSITTSGQFAVVVDMVNPTNAPLLQASDGNFYGTTTGGHAGTVFEMPPGGALTTIHSFDVTDGRIPEAGLTEGSDGNLYGTTDESGTFSGTPDDGGTVFSITLGGGTFTLLHSFSGTDGQNPLSAGLVEGSDGYFYGTTESSTPGEGTVFKVFPTGEFQSLHTFTGTDGGDPVGGLLLASDGNFYGTTEGGGVPPPTGSQSGTVFKMTPDGTLTTLYTFTGLADGGTPECNLVEGKDGNFYGTTSTGAISNNGTVFVITPAGVLTTLHQFAGYPTDGGSPQNGLLLASDGNFYGTTHYGGANNMGTVFQMIVTPAPSPAVTSATVDSGTVGAPFTYQITATNGPTSFGASGLPAGLSVAANGLISGVPTQPGTFAVTLSASNGRGTGSALLQLTIATPVTLPVVTLEAIVPEVTVGSEKHGEIKIKLSSVQTRPVLVHFAIKGSAINGTDCVLLTDTRKIPAGQVSKIIKITPRGDLEGAKKKAIELVLQPGQDYRRGSKIRAKVTIKK